VRPPGRFARAAIRSPWLVGAAAGLALLVVLLGTDLLAGGGSNIVLAAVLSLAFAGTTVVKGYRLRRAVGR
jgi:hypothetical protein